MNRQLANKCILDVFSNCANLSLRCLVFEHLEMQFADSQETNCVTIDAQKTKMINHIDMYLELEL